MPTRTVGKTEAKQQGTHLAWCVCVAWKRESCERCFPFAELLTTFRRSLWKVFLGAFVLGFN